MSGHKWQCPKCQRVYGDYYIKREVSCLVCGLNVASFQHFVDRAGDAAHTTRGVDGVDRRAGRTTDQGGHEPC